MAARRGRVHDRDLAGGAVRRRRQPALPGRHRPARCRPGPGPWIATAYGPPWDAMNGSGVTATGLNLTAGQPAYEIAVDPAVIPLQSFEHVTPNPFGTTPRVLRRRHRRRDHRPPRRHLRLAGPRRPERLGRPPRHRHARAQPRHRQPARRDHPDRAEPASRDASAAGCATSAGGPLPLTPGPAGEDPPERARRRAERRAAAVKLAIAAGNQLISKPYIYGRRSRRPAEPSSTPATTARARPATSCTPPARSACTPRTPRSSRATASPGPGRGSPCTRTRGTRSSPSPGS